MLVFINSHNKVNKKIKENIKFRNNNKHVTILEHNYNFKGA